MLSERSVIRCICLEPFHQRFFTDVAQVEFDNIPSPLPSVRFVITLLERYVSLLGIDFSFHQIKPQRTEGIVWVVLIKRQQIILRQREAAAIIQCDAPV
ncbi:hypothetical protein D3C85_1748200 [compost metagenome]